MNDKREIRLVVSEKEIIALMTDLKSRQSYDNISRQLHNELIRITEIQENGQTTKQ